MIVMCLFPFSRVLHAHTGRVISGAKNGYLGLQHLSCHPAGVWKKKLFCKMRAQRYSRIDFCVMFVSVSSSKQVSQFLLAQKVPFALWKWSCLVCWFINHCQVEPDTRNKFRFQDDYPYRWCIKYTEYNLIFISHVDFAEQRLQREIIS